MTTVIFASPAGTGKTTYGALLARHFGCTSVVEAEELRSMSETVRKHKLGTALILCQDPAREVPFDPYIRARRTLQREEMNAAMAMVGGEKIWNEDGTVNSFKAGK